MTTGTLTDDRRFGFSGRWLARTTGILYSSGALVAFVYVLLPHGAEAGDGVVLAMAILALALGLALAAGVGDRAPRSLFHVVVVLIQVIISVGYIATATPTAPLFQFYLWTTTYAWLMFERGPALLQTAWTATCLAVSLLLIDPPLVVGLRVWLMVMCTEVAMGVLVGYVAGRIRQTQAQLRYAATHDPLTELPNRRFFAEAVGRAIRGRDTRPHTVHVLLIDLDHFKLINDNFGHPIGDQILRALAVRLRDVVGDTDVVARMGGDEFAIVARLGPSAPREDAALADISVLLERLAAVFDQPLAIDQRTMSVSASIGVSTPAAPGAETEQLLQQADAALYKAKNSQRGSVAFFDSALGHEVDRRALLDQALRLALTREEFAVFYQPIVDLGTGRLQSAEALLRWEAAGLGPISPVEFIPIAEEIGLIVPIGDWVLNQVADQLARWRSDGNVEESFVVAVNVSVRQLIEGFAARVQDVLAARGLPISAIALEITESALLDDSKRFGLVLAELRASRVSLVLDDFGTGYSSIALLEMLPLQKLKIDRSFVTALPDSRRGVGLVTAIIAMAASLEMEVVAEGVETGAQSAMLQSLGARWGQGFLFGHPMSDEEFLRWTACAV